jgi:predicted transposase YbfD/YdcC
MDTLTTNQTNTLYCLFQNADLDKRDNRGKRLKCCYIFVSLMLALFRNRDGNLSSIHRSMVNKHDELCGFLGLAENTPRMISRSHLPIFLQSVDLKLFADVLHSFSGTELDDKEKKWFAIDGKEMRGSIIKGDKRGDAVVLAVDHGNGHTYAQDFYSGVKESEKICVRELLDGAGLAGQKITLDALHLSPKTMAQIESKEGIYIVGLKENQEVLLADMELSSQTLAVKSVFSQTEKGHGRVEQRNYKTYSIDCEYTDQRWAGANFKTLVKVNRIIYDCKKKTQYEETAFYISNQGVKNTSDVELAHAIRQHWRVETNNHLRDVTLKEDKQRTIKTGVTKVLATCRTLVINLLNQLRPPNMVAQLELFSDNFKVLLNWCREINLL